MSIENDPKALQRIHRARLISRDIDQLLGICEFALQDGHIDQSEAEAILSWLHNHPGCLNTWPANILFDQLRSMLEDGVLDDDEQRLLLSLVLRIAIPPNKDGNPTPCPLPLNDPPPTIVITDRNFCFTGVFEFGTRAICRDAILQRGGNVLNNVTKKLDYLVIGNVGSDAWKHRSFGEKIMKSVSYRDAGIPLYIVSEDHWTFSINEAAPC